MRVLVIEDELLAQDELVRLINLRFPQMEIVGRTSSVKESIEWLNRNSVDLIFMDIHLSDGICFDIFDYVKIMAPVIFTTAYDQYAIRAFQANGIGYLLKPIIDNELIQAVEKLSRLTYNVDLLKNVASLTRGSQDYKSRILIKKSDKFSFLKTDNIAYFYSEERLTYVVPMQGHKRLIDYTIEELEKSLDPRRFFRASRGCIISIDSIDSVSKHFNSRLKVLLNPKYEGELLVSRVRVADFINWLDG